MVDDDRLVLAALERGLRAEGYDIDAAGDGEEALAMAGRFPYDLAILDIRLPDTTGIELARSLRRLRNLPSLFFSAYDDLAQIDEAVAEGGLGYLIKPVTPRQLMPAIEAALARARDLRALLQTKERLEDAVDAARNTSTAVGILMERRRLGRDEAFQYLRAEARNQRRPIEALAGCVVKAAETLNTLKDGD